MRRRWGIAMVGNESGQRRLIPWFKFWRRATAEGWVARMEAQGIEGPFEPLTRYEVVDLKGSP